MKFSFSHFTSKDKVARVHHDNNTALISTVNKKFAELKVEIVKNNNALTSTVTGLKAGIEQGISALKENQKKTQESLDIILARLLPHTSFFPPSHNPHLDPFNMPPPNTSKSPGQHNTMPPHEVPFFSIPSISIP